MGPHYVSLGATKRWMSCLTIPKYAAGGVFLFTCLAAAQTPNPQEPPIESHVVAEVARGQSWVSPYWGYSTPKIVCDGGAYYTALLWGPEPDQAEGVLYKSTGPDWSPGRRLRGIYQPATLALDAKGRLIAAYTQRDKPIVLLRSRTPGDIHDLETLSPPPDMPNAYYIGIAIRNEVLYLAYLTTPAYTMCLAQLDLASLAWSPSCVLQEGQPNTKPKIAWTYPILVPSGEGLHFAASNCPDGSEGNTYNQVWYLFIPNGATAPAIREMVADCPPGHFAYAMDLAVDHTGVVHVVLMWNQRKYGDPLPKESPPAGTYHARRDPVTGEWRRQWLSPLSIAGLYAAEKRLLVVTQEAGGIVPFEWQPAHKTWRKLPPLCTAHRVPAGPSFMDVLAASSGSNLSGGLALVSDGVLADTTRTLTERVVWALLPAAKP